MNNRLKCLAALALCFACTLGWAQERETAAPKWAAKAQKSIVSVLAYDEKNELLKSGAGVVVSADGVVVADYELLRGAYGAAVVDADGRRWEAERVLGADNMYNLVKLKTALKKAQPAQLGGSAAAAAGSRVYALPYSKQKLVLCPASTVEKKDIFGEKYAYYTLATAIDAKYTGCPLFNADGELLGIVQSAIGGKSYAVDAAYGRDLSIQAIESKAGALALSGIHMKKGLPNSMEEALVYLYFQSRSASNDRYMDMLNLFISQYPQNAEGYYRRATPLLDLQRFDEADADLKTYLRLAADKMTAHSNVAQTIYTKLLYQPEAKYEKWTYDLALDHCQQAIDMAEQKASAAATDSLRQEAETTAMEYRLQKAQILMAKKDDAAAIAIYDDINAGPYRSPATLYAASMAHEAAGDSLATQIDLMDQAIDLFGKPLKAEAANYVMRRAKLLQRARRFREAVADYNQFASLQTEALSANFFYDRAMLEQDARMYQQALADLDSAIALEPSLALLHVEKSALLLRVNMVDECIVEAKKCIELNPQMYDAFRILGYAQIQKGDKAAARRNLEQAKALGDDSAQDLIDKYLK